MENFYKRVLKAQNELKAPKNLYNDFGGFKHRSCEDILEAAKPICAKYGLLLNLSDMILNIGDRYYVEATATLYDVESEAKLESTASARESEEKKKLDASQLTGVASSYARKYALGGLFCIDDTKDADSTEFHNVTKETKKEEAQPQPQKEVRCSHCGALIKGRRSKDGSILSAEQVKAQLGGLCIACWRATQNPKEENPAVSEEAAK